MKKLIPLLVIIGIVFIQLQVFANVGPHTPVGSNVTYDQCVRFQSNQLTATGTGHFGHCVKASCFTGTWQVQYLISENLGRCANGNTNRFTQIVNSGCTSYVGSCTPTNQVRYCTLVTFFDCGRTMNGQPFVPPTVAPPTTRPPTTRPPTTRPPTTRPPGQPTTRPPAEPVVESDNNFLQSLSVTDFALDFNKEKLNYTLEITEEVTTLEVTAIPEDERAVVLVEHFEEIDVEQPIIITVTAENGEVRTYTINLRYEEEVLDSNTRLRFLEVAGYNLKFDADINSYTLRIGDETSLIIDYETESEFAEVEIIGNSNLKNKSQIRIEVTAQDGTQDVYLLDIRKSFSGNVLGVVIVVIIIGVAGFVGFKLVKKILKGKEEAAQYEYE